jgi:YHS domain-containing protein
VISAHSPAHGVTLGSLIAGERIVFDPRAGVALYGFDAVEYFLSNEARAGSESHEIAFEGLTWRFVSEANLAAFRAAPDAYVPRFGGYDPMALDRGAPVAGHPRLFAVHEGRLYLFYSEANRDAFLAAPLAAIKGAQAQWPRARRSLVY